MKKEEGPGQGPDPEAATSACTLRRPCDFCPETGAKWVFEARPITRSVAASYLYVALNGRWRACDACMPMAERGDWKRLAKRVRRLSPVDYLSSPVMVTELVALWMVFQQRRTGPPRRIEGQRRGVVA